MSSSTGNFGGGDVAPQLYFCHQCNRTVTITPSPTSELLCPNCNTGFIEELDSSTSPNPNTIPNPIFPSDSFPPFSTGLQPVAFSTSGGNADDLSTFFGGLQARSVVGPGEFNPFAFLQNYFNTLRAGGANVQFVIENRHGGADPGSFRLPANLGDYFIGPGLEQLIQQLAENDPNRCGTPPASKSAIEALPNIKISKDLLASDNSQCAVCKDTFELGEETKQMPCKHIYHPDCILPWLEINNSCPVCRYELPTDDPDYENRTRGLRGPGTAGSGLVASASAAGSGSGGGSSQDSTPSPRTLERRFSISLPWPFSVFGSRAETSNSGGAQNENGNNNENNNNRESNSNRGGSQAREEDLD